MAGGVAARVAVHGCGVGRGGVTQRYPGVGEWDGVVGCYCMVGDLASHCGIGCSRLILASKRGGGRWSGDCGLKEPTGRASLQEWMELFGTGGIHNESCGNNTWRVQQGGVFLWDVGLVVR